MAAIEIVTLPFKRESLNTIDRNEKYLNYPVIYILNGKKEAYIGETVYFENRMKAHLKSRENIEQIHLVNHEKFNRSATFHLETKLINYFLGDEKYTLQNKSKTTSDFTHNYFHKSYYDQEVFEDLWSKLYEKKIVQHTLHTIENKDIFKISPFKELSLEQIQLKEKILDFCEEHIQSEKKEYGKLLIIEGEAGVGKSVVLSSIFNTLEERTRESSSKLHKTENYLVVHHEEMYKTYKNIARQVQHLKAKSFVKATPLINRLNKENKDVDIILVDEAHLLLTKQDVFKHFRLNNHLEELMKRAKIVIIVFDPNQILKFKSYWNQQTLDQMKKLSTHNETFQLTNQFRMKASNSIIEWINSFKEKNVLPIPKSTDLYEFEVFEYIEDMHKKIISKNKSEGLSRVVSTFDFLHKKDNKTYYVSESNGEYKLPWNTTSKDYTWAENPQTINEVGSIYTVQGFDLNYVGVILGPAIQYDELKSELVIDSSLYKDREAYAGREKIEDIPKAKEQIILNSINILMKRGIKGLYIYASNEMLRKKLLSHQ